MEVHSSLPSVCPKVVVTAFLDATDPLLERAVATQLDELAGARGAEISALVYRKGASPTYKSVRGVIEQFSWVLPLGVCAAAIPFSQLPLGLTLALLLGTGGAASLGLRLGLDRLVSHGRDLREQAARDRQLRPLPAWKGMRTYRVGEAVELLASDPSATRPDAGRFTRLMVQDWKAYPRATHVVYVSGHGTLDSVAGLKAVALQQALADAGRAAGTRADVVVLDACLMNNLEFLIGLPAGVAVGSAEWLGEQGFPAARFVAAALEAPGAPRAIGRQMVELAGSRQNVSSVAAIDLDALRGRLLPALDRLASALLVENQRGQKKVLRASLPETFFEGGESADLGEFLQCLQQQPSLGPEARQAVHEALEALGKTVLLHKHAPAYAGTWGLSFQPEPDEDAAKGLPKSWKALLRCL